jgi:ABC-type lipoprotein export system ATPase subunit
MTPAPHGATKPPMETVPAEIPPVLEVRDLSKSFNDQHVLKSISLSVHPGERLALTGPSGSGKSTLLNCISGLVSPDAGHVRIAGQQTTGLPLESHAAVMRRHTGSIFQFFHLLPTLTVLENVAFPLMLLGTPREQREEQARRYLARVGLSAKNASLPHELSGGEMQRVAIGRALIHHPSLLLADEPTGNLDSKNSATILDLLSELTAENGTALVMVTHSRDAAAICHRNVSILDGQLVDASPLN